MKQLTILELHRRKYNDVLRRCLRQAGIRSWELSARYGLKLMVSKDDFNQALRIMLKIPHHEPEYYHIHRYIEI